MKKQSIKEKIEIATNWAFKLLDKSENLPDVVFHWTDGLSQAYYYRMFQGRCSLSALIKFDVNKAEKNIDNVIEDFRKLYATLNRETDMNNLR